MGQGKKNGGELAGLGELLALGLLIGLCIAFGVMAGLAVDRWAGTAPVGVFGGFFVGLAAAVVQSARIIRAADRKS